MAMQASSSAEQKAYPGRGGARSHPRLHGICQKRLEHAVNKSKQLAAETQLVILITAPPNSLSSIYGSQEDQL